MASWDDEDYEPPMVSNATNKWEGEDEEHKVKASWEDEDEEKELPKIQPQLEASKSKKKKLSEKIAEKERRELEERENRLREEQDEDISKEEQIKRQIESDLQVALETTFRSDDNSATNCNLKLPSTKEEFNEFIESLTKQLQPLSKRDDYPSFIEKFVRNLCASLNSSDIRKVKMTLDNLYIEKQKLENAEKSKKTKGKGKANLKVERDHLLDAYASDHDGFDDLM